MKFSDDLSFDELKLRVSKVFELEKNAFDDLKRFEEVFGEDDVMTKQMRNQWSMLFTVVKILERGEEY